MCLSEEACGGRSHFLASKHLGVLYNIISILCNTELVFQPTDETFCTNILIETYSNTTKTYWPI